MKKSNLRSLIIIFVLIGIAIVVPLNSAMAFVDDSYTKSLLHFDGSDTSTTFTDESGKSWSHYGNSQIKTAQSKFGGASGYFDGSGDYIRTPYTSDFDLSSGDFTIDAWFRSNSFSSVQVITSKDTYGSSYDWSVRIASSTTINIYTNGTNDHLTATVPTMSTGTWYHVAVVSYSGDVSIYLDGVSYGSKSMSITNASQSYVTVGCSGWNQPGGYFNGYIDELRISKGIARWTDDFTPPSAAYEPEVTPTITNTPTVTNTPTITNTPTLTNTPTITNTPTNTVSPTHTFTPTITPTPTLTNTPNSFFATSTATETSTPSITPTITETPTITNTPTPNPITSITWAHADDIDSDLLDAMETYLLANPPQGEDPHRIYGVADTSNDSGTWNISIMNLVNVTGPDYEWNFENNVVWAGSLDCTGTDPNWTCSLYQPVVGGEGGEGSVLWPWRPGTSAVYGVSGIHGLNSGFLPGSRAIDFVGDDNWGSDIMPAVAYAAADGTITSACHDDHSAGIVVDSGAAGKFLYLHLNKNDTTLAKGNHVYAGKPISSLTYGSFGDYNGNPSCPTTCADGTDCRCGCASQGINQYHLHFATIPVDGYILLGGCQINTNTGNILCGTTNYKINSRIPNGGSSYQPTPNPSGNGSGSTSPTTSALGGEHIWDGLVNGLVDVADNVRSLFPAHTSLNLSDKVSNASTQIFSIVMFVNGLQLFYLVPTFIIIGVILTIEAGRWIVNLWIKVLNIIGLA
jgi:hypothetical protein